MNPQIGGASARSRIFVGEVLDVRPHPNASRIFISLVSTGASTSLQVIFGGIRMLSPGDKVAVAMAGARLPSGEKIRSRRYRGEQSAAELLSSNELGWTYEGPDAVIVFDDTFPVGLPLCVAYQVIDVRQNSDGANASAR